MKFKFWGVRGSIPTPGPRTVKYGGNTTCIEIRTDDNDLFILDAGTGIHALAQSLLKEMPIHANIFITHTHWDHIQGLPFFTPIFISNNRITIYGSQDPVTGEGISRALTVQLQYSFFPIREAQLNARVEYKTLIPGVPINIGKATITPIVLSHPVLNFGYRVDCDGQSLFFTGDYEPELNIYSPEDEEYEQFQVLIEEKWQEVVTAMANVDALIVDSSYTVSEYVSKRGWGHGTYASAIQLATAAKVKKLFFTHHEPTRTDADLDVIYQSLLQQYPAVGFDFELAQEGFEIPL
ncbi:MAG: MBL fold metallo-hydrolase [Methylococcaceae bacterium]|jgi:phosphoribosyl 1,2-cyclic phosphodiesterase|nr:MBL fold metallo-hydrolase [Methylococcaceae bacterium]MDZ4157861.1 MBL fold metallo-hydrolase [Methylococcales bacterium]MDP2392366.1 MBL fold metallo-hydrolase [Methylococcaceae bacterium]MDP3021260.1 MBL fold metallo-hydrolase [Methylococcaceae bacterium]MDP3390844.1 MBL fold metallo-hydrolase [Methylococcaceae bacterium]